MRKFLAFLKISWQETVTYRAERVLWTVMEVGGLIPILSLWYILGKQNIISFSQTQYLVVYYLLINVFSRITSSELEEWLIENIKDGQISRDLVKPFSFHQYLIANELAWRVSAIIYVLPVIVLLLFYVSPVSILMLLIFFPAIFLQRVFVSMLIAISAFWIDQAKSLVHLKWMCASIFGGTMIPLTFFPVELMNFARFTPFYSWGFFPAQAVLGKLTTLELVYGIVTIIIWTFCLYWLTEILWSLAVKKYGASGG